MNNNIQIKYFSNYNDGYSTETALVTIYGREYSVHYDDKNAPRIFATAEYNIPKWKRTRDIEIINQWVKENNERKSS